ncbi:DUF6254 family protein [Paenibacillus sp. YAF4_2]
MTSPKNRRENAWKQRKHTQHPTHGKVKSFEELSKEVSRNNPNNVEIY